MIQFNWLYTLLLPLLNYISTIGSFIIIITSICFGLSIYKLTGSKLIKFERNIKHRSINSTDNNYEGWVIGKWFIGIYRDNHSERMNNRTLYIFMSCYTYNKYISENDTDLESGNCEVNKNITLYEREGSYNWLSYSKRNISFFNKIPNIQQDKIIKKIEDTFNHKKHCVCLIYGPPGTGKSYVSLLLANSLLKEKENVSIVKTFSPIDPNDNFSSLYNTVNPSFNKPLIIILEEIDEIISSIHNKNIIKHKSYPIQVTNKPSWNSFLDDIDRDFYPNIILFMTTNKNIDYFNNLDNSYIREGRVDFKMNIIN